jgi:hypothetical protein
VSSSKVARAQGPWRVGLWLSLALVVLAALSLAPYMTSSTELVRMRNALLLDDRYDAAQDWAPPAYPPDFKREQAAPYPAFVNVVQQLGLPAMANDWDRALAISKHLLGSSPVLSGGAIQSDLTDTHRRIINKGEGYCGDFVRAFTAIAEAAGTTRPWAFSFDGFGGDGHIWLEIWNRQAQAWQLLDVFDNYYFVLASDRPLSALELRRALTQQPGALHLRRLYAPARPGYVIEAKAWSFFQRGQPEWYQWRGTNVFSYDKNWLVHALGKLSRSLEQLGGIVAGVSPRLVILSDAGNRAAYEALRRLQWQLYAVAVVVPLGLLMALLCWIQLRRQRLRTGSVSLHA